MNKQCLIISKINRSYYVSKRFFYQQKKRCYSLCYNSMESCNKCHFLELVGYSASLFEHRTNNYQTQKQLYVRSAVKLSFLVSVFFLRHRCTVKTALSREQILQHLQREQILHMCGLIQYFGPRQSKQYDVKRIAVHVKMYASTKHQVFPVMFKWYLSTIWNDGNSNVLVLSGGIFLL